MSKVVSYILAALERAQEDSMDIQHRKHFNAFSSDIPTKEYVGIQKNKKRSLPRSGVLKSSRNPTICCTCISCIMEY